MVEFTYGAQTVQLVIYRRSRASLEEMGERNYISTTAGLLADVLYRQDRYTDAAEFAGICEQLASLDDVASQFLWRWVQGLRRGEGAAFRGDGAHRDL
jgi:hypothetical protein